MAIPGSDPERRSAVDLSLPATKPPPFALVTDDRVWVARIRAGELSAFEALFRAYHKPLAAFVLDYVDSAAVAEELVQDVFFRVWQRRERWEVRDTIRRYLYGAARNAALNYVRQERTVQRAHVTPSGERPRGMAWGADATDAQVRVSELSAAIARAVAALPDRCRQAYLLRLHHQLAYVEIARVMGLSVKRIEFLLTRAHKLLREALAPFF